ncbi:MAG: hypothetical protein AAGA99_17630 [Actinomycetota bacterium]
MHDDEMIRRLRRLAGPVRSPWLNQVAGRLVEKANEIVTLTVELDRAHLATEEAVADGLHLRSRIAAALGDSSLTSDQRVDAALRVLDGIEAEVQG